jgi:hypothetical protein
VHESTLSTKDRENIRFPLQTYEAVDEFLSSVKLRILEMAANHALEKSTSAETIVVSEENILDSIRVVLPAATFEFEKAFRKRKHARTAS